MKRLILYFSIVCLVACQTEPALKAELECADSLCMVAPNEAGVLLDSLKGYVWQESEHTLRLWQLLRIKAQDKADRPLTSDTIIKKVVAYFDKHGSVKERIEAYYYLGRTYHELHDSPRAVTAYLTSQLSGLYLRQRNPRAVVDVTLKGYKVALTYGILTPVLVMDVATGYKYLNKVDSAGFYYDKAMSMIKKARSENLYAGCISEVCSHYSTCKNREKADYYLKMLNQIPEEYRDYNYNSDKAIYFEAFGPEDSLIYYNQMELLDSTKYGSVSNAACSLMEIYSKRGNYQLACHYAQIYSVANEAYLEQLRLEQTRDANNEYKYRRDMPAEAEAYREAGRMRELIGLIVAACTIVLLMGVALHFYRQREMERRLRLQAETIEQQDTELSKKEKDIDSLSQKMLTKGIRVHPKEVFQHFDAATEGKVSILQEWEWEQLAAALETMYPGFSATAHRLCPRMKVNDFHIACLLKMGYGVSAITRATCMAKTTVHRKISHIRQALGELLDEDVTQKLQAGGQGSDFPMVGLTPSN